MVFLTKLEIRGKFAETINLLFQSFLITYLILFLIEQVWIGSVSFYLNLNYFLMIIIVLGILHIFSEHKKQKSEKIRVRDYVFISILGILGLIIIKIKTADLGWLSWIISIIAGILIVLLSVLVLGEDELTDEKKLKRKINKLSLKKIIFFVFLVFILISLLLGIFTSLTYLESFRIIFGSIYVLFLPGFIISFIFFPKAKEFYSEANRHDEEKDAIDLIERIALSFALSIAIVPLAIFYLNLIGVKINILNSFLVILGIIILSGLIFLVKTKKGRLNNSL